MMKRQQPATGFAFGSYRDDGGTGIDQPEGKADGKATATTELRSARLRTLVRAVPWLVGGLYEVALFIVSPVPGSAIFSEYSTVMTSVGFASYLPLLFHIFLLPKCPTIADLMTLCNIA